MKLKLFILFLATFCITIFLFGCNSSPKVLGTTETYVYSELPNARTPVQDSLHISAYLRTWPLDIENNPYWKASEIRGDLLTEVNISFANIKEDGTIFIPDTEQNSYYTGNPPFALKEEIAELRRLYPDLLVTLSIGGGGVGGFSEMANDPAKRKIFVESVVLFMKEYNFTGTDIDWESPVGPDWGQSITCCPEDKVAWILLLADLRNAFDKLETETNQYYTVSVAVSAGAWFTQKNDVVAAAKICDTLKIMCYDFYGSWSATTGHNSCLYTNSADIETICASGGIENYTSLGISASKLQLGIPFYAIAWSGVKDNDKHGLFQKYTKYEGSLQNSDLVKYGYSISEGTTESFTQYWDEEAKFSWLYDGDTFVSFLDEKAIQSYVQYAKDNNLSGMMYWEYGDDMQAQWLEILYTEVKRK